MKTLREQQLAFSAYLKGDKTSAIIEDIIGDEKGSSVERIELYHDAYRLRLIDVLASDYPGLQSLLGEEDFNRVCLAYIEHYPSIYKSVRWFGQHLPEFLESNEYYTFDPRLFEIAKFEKLKGDIFDIEESDCASLDDLAAIESRFWGALRVRFIPACLRMDFSYPIPTIWLSMQDDQSSGDKIVTLKDTWEQSEEVIPWLMWRFEYNPHWRSLEVDEAWAIDQLMQGKTFGEMCVGLEQWIDEEHIPLRAVGFLKNLVSQSVVQKFEI